MWSPSSISPTVRSTENGPGLKPRTAEAPSVKSTTHHLPWSPSGPSLPSSSPAEAPTVAFPEAPPDGTSPDFPFVAMLRAPKLWLLPHSTFVPIVTPILPSPASPQDRGDTTARPVSLGAENLEMLSQTTRDAPVEANHKSPAADSREIRGISSIQAPKHPISGQWVSLNSSNVTTNPVSSDAGILGTESEVLDISRSTTSSGQATVGKVLATWLPLSSQELDSLLGDHGVTVSMEPTVALAGGTTKGPLKAIMELVPRGADATWGSEPKSSFSSTHVAVSSSMNQGTITGAQDMPTEASTSSEGHPELQDQTVAQGSPGPPSSPPSLLWSSLTSNTDEAALVSSGEPTGMWDTPSTLTPVSLGLKESDLNVVAKSPGLEDFWEEVASGQEGKFWILHLSQCSQDLKLEVGGSLSRGNTLGRLGFLAKDGARSQEASYIGLLCCAVLGALAGMDLAM